MGVIKIRIQKNFGHEKEDYSLFMAYFLVYR